MLTCKPLVIEFKCDGVTSAQSVIPVIRLRIADWTFNVRSHRLALWAVATVTEIVCVAVRLPSLAVTVTVALPAATGVIVTVDPDTLTVAMLVLLELAV